MAGDSNSQEDDDVQEKVQKLWADERKGYVMEIERLQNRVSDDDDDVG